ncbi:beta-ketoacyl synthase N-terminal-like domain-containing protein [Streptomyces millisiae]|uniref:Beta-ketoacyl synthase N-terminal-like domain-containing protein n=1 Tax=Streptomyces millisiae TaxID=3075542 RepID=A0ABU2LIB7_9ACTN|nr:beta-ketoacyl synthase N-terminal-like domain-containing protein [Streptomyces sp. DSM 44918]MDT0317329.1 beta-ketoacyl synthase N-terminal-like domain-containing protein [Streptomyces sp. DSM 44918]
MTTSVLDPVAITGCGVVSPAGAGLDALRALLDGETTANATPVAEDAEALPPVAVRTVPEIRLADYVGRKGTRRLDRMIGFTLIATRLALESAGGADDDALRARTGVAVGTTTGSVRSVYELAHSIFRPEVGYVPSRFPNSVMNSCAGQVAVWNAFQGVNSTLANGHASSASALRYARNAIRFGHATRVFVGGVEELSPQVAWGWHKSGTLTQDALLGEGCAMLVAEDPARVGDREVLAELLGAEVGYFDPRDRRITPARGLARCVTRLLERAGLTAGDVDLVSPGAASQHGARAVEEYGLRLALGELPAAVRVSEAVGDCYSASGALQAAAVLARWSGGSHPGERHALVSSLGTDGSVGCFLLRRPAA